MIYKQDFSKCNTSRQLQIWSTALTATAVISNQELPAPSCLGHFLFIAFCFSFSIHLNRDAYCFGLIKKTVQWLNLKQIQKLIILLLSCHCNRIPCPYHSQESFGPGEERKKILIFPALQKFDFVNLLLLIITY